MLRMVAKSKIHGLRVTDKNLAYGGSLTLDAHLLAAADLVCGERVQVVNLANGSRVETYVIEGEAGSGMVVLNGPAARSGEVGDVVHVICYALMADDELARGLPCVVSVDEGNHPLTP
jgi:aspartate 1-decarboxylase